MLTLYWNTRDVQGQLLRFFDVKLETVRSEGVYVIYSMPNLLGVQDMRALGNILAGPRTIYVGQGVVADRLQQHRSNQTMRAMNSQSTLYVAFADLGSGDRDHVERWLANRLQPMLGDAHPNAVPVEVNLPFAA